MFEDALKVALKSRGFRTTMLDIRENTLVVKGFPAGCNTEVDIWARFQLPRRRRSQTEVIILPGIWAKRILDLVKDSILEAAEDSRPMGPILGPSPEGPRQTDQSGR